MPRQAVTFLSLVLLWSVCAATVAPPLAVEALTHGIPPRLPHALTGSQFAQSVGTLTPPRREQAIQREILAGNLPVDLPEQAGAFFLRNSIDIGRIEFAGVNAAAAGIRMSADDRMYDVRCRRFLRCCQWQQIRPLFYALLVLAREAKNRL